MKNDSVVTIYDLKNNGKPLECHRADAREFLKLSRWSTSPEVKKDEGAQGKEINQDNGQTILLKSMSLAALKSTAEKAGVPGYQKMNKADLVAALEAK